MRSLGRWVLLAALLGASAFVLSIPAPPIQADDEAPVVVNLAPKNCKQPGTLIDPFVCSNICPALPCNLNWCARECDTSITCQYTCPVGG